MLHSSTSATLLTADAAARKLRRMAYQIWERHATHPSVVLLGVERSGVAIATALARLLQEISPLEVHTESLNVGTEAGDLPAFQKNTALVIVDDVASTGRTLMRALARLAGGEPATVSVAVLVDRAHKAFPITPDIVGLSVSTTMQEHIEVTVEHGVVAGAYLR